MPKCELCGKEDDLKEYKIVDKLGTRYRNICPECAEKLNTNQATLQNGNESFQNATASPQSNSSSRIQIINQNPERKTKPLHLYIIGALFLVAAMIFYFISVNNDYGVANIQTTVFAGACFVSAIVSFTGGTIIKALQEK